MEGCKALLLKQLLSDADVFPRHRDDAGKPYAI